MQIKIRNGQITLDSVFKIVATGWVVLLVPVFTAFATLFTLIRLVGGERSSEVDASVAGTEAFPHILYIWALFPLILILQAVLFGAIIAGGFALYRHFRPVTLVMVRDSDVT